MKMAPKITLIIGGVMLVGSIIALVAGIGGTDFEGEELFSGEAPVTFTEEFEAMAIYNVFVSGSDVSVFANGTNIEFITCQEEMSCAENNRVGYQFAGRLEVLKDGTYEITFDGEGEVLVTKTEIGGLLAAVGGFWCGCCSVLVLIVGLIMALVMKDDQVAQVVVMPGQVQAVPVAGVSPVPVNIDYSDPAESYYASMMAQGFDAFQAAEITREQYPGWNK